MAEYEAYMGQKEGERRTKSANVKSSGKYHRFGEIIRYMALEEYQKFTDSIDDRKHCKRRSKSAADGGGKVQHLASIYA
jgi:hypothetical protein